MNNIASKKIFLLLLSYIINIMLNKKVLTRSLQPWPPCVVQKYYPLPSPTHPSYPQPDYPADFLGVPQAMTLLVLSNKLRTGQNPIQLSHLSVGSRSL